MKTFSEALQGVYKDRKEKRKSYSIRAFSRDCKVPSPRMCDYFNGNRPINVKAATAILNNLPMHEREVQVLKESFSYSYSRNKKVYVLSEDDLKNVCHPVYFAFLSQLQADNGNENDQEIAKALDLDHDNYERVKSVLLQSNLIKVNDGKPVANYDRVETTFEIPREDIRNAQKASLKRIIDHLDDVDVARRDVTKYTVVTNPKKIQQAKIRTQKFARKLAEFLESGAKTEVYELAIQLFPWRVSK